MAARGERWVEVAVVGRPHGIRGELYVRPHNPDTELLTTGRQLATPAGEPAAAGESPGPAPRVLTVQRVQRTGQGWLVKFEGVDQREVAAALTNHKLFVRRGELPALAQDELYQSDVVGAQAVASDGRVLGVVRGFFSTPAHDVCVLETPSGVEALVPFHRETVVDYDAEAQRLTLELPEGLPGLEDDASEEDEDSDEAGRNGR